MVVHAESIIHWGHVSLFYKITNDMIHKYHDKPWDWVYMSMNKHLTWDIVKERLDKPWNWEFIGSKNKNITLQIIEENPNCPWEWKMICRYKTLTLDNIVNKNLPDSYWEYISMNENIYKPDAEFKAHFAKQWHASNTIKRDWLKCITDPTFRVCKKRLRKEFGEICFI